MSHVADAHLCQPELHLRLRKRTPEKIANDVREFEQLLLGREALTARQIEGLRPEWAEPDQRYVRELASRSKAVVSAPGVRGYMHADAVSLPQLSVIHAARRAQIKAEIRELARIGQLLALRRKDAALITTPQPTHS